MLLLLKLLIFDLSFVTSHEITDFQGITLTAMTHAYSPAIMLHDNYTKTSMYFPENDTYEVTNQVYGLYFDILQSLQKELNFTTKLYKRKDKVLGFPTKSKNGSLVPNGALENMYEKSADFILASMFIHADRAHFVDFLDPLKITHYGIYISKIMLRDQVDYHTFLRPFSSGVWMAWVSCNLTFVIFVLLGFLFKKQDYNGFKIGFFIVALFGNVLWISFGARLTSELAVRIIELPFENLESLYDSDYKLITGKPGTFSYAYWANSTVGIEQKVFKKNVDASSLALTNTEKVEKVLHEPKLALFISLAYAPIYLEKHLCKV